MVLFRGENREDKLTDQVRETEARLEVGPPQPNASDPMPADPELQATGRRFAAEEEPRILREADACAPGEVAAPARVSALFRTNASTISRS